MSSNMTILCLPFFQVLIASKADGKQLQALRDALAELQQGGGGMVYYA